MQRMSQGLECRVPLDAAGREQGPSVCLRWQEDQLRAPHAWAPSLRLPGQPAAPSSPQQKPDTLFISEFTPPCPVAVLIVLSSCFSGPESGAGQNEVTLQVANPSELRAQSPSSYSTCTDPATQDPGEGGESPVVQSDEEGVEVDTALATLHTDDSDS